MGRKAGVPNKPTGEFSVRARLKEMGIDLIGEILQHINDIKDPEPKARMKLQLLEYCDSKRKAVEVTEVKATEKDLEGVPIEQLELIAQGRFNALAAAPQEENQALC